MNDQAMQLIEQLAAKLGVSIYHIMGVLVRQAIITGVIRAVITLFFGYIVFLLFGEMKRVLLVMRDTSPDDDETSRAAYYFVCIVIYITVVCLTINGTISAIINPEFWALERILQAIK